MSAELRLANPATPVTSVHTISTGNTSGDLSGAQHLHAIDSSSTGGGGHEIEDIVAGNLSRLRALHHLSLDGLARKSGVSRAMLAQIESGRSVPTIRVLQRVASALQVSVSAFLRSFAAHGVALLPVQDTPRIVSGNGRYISRTLHPAGERRFAFHEIRLDALATEQLPALVPGTQKNLVITHGTLEIQLNEQRLLLGTGDAIYFDADQPHSYRNPADTEALAYVVIQYPENHPV